MYQPPRALLRLGMRVIPRTMPHLFPQAFPHLFPRSFDRHQILSRDSWGQLVVFSKAFVVMVAVLGAVWSVHRNITSRWIHDLTPSLGVACLMVQFVLALAGLAASGSIKKRDQRRLRREAHLLPVIRKRLTAHLLHEGSDDELRKLRRQYPREFELCLLESLNHSQGQARERLSALAESLGFVTQWQQDAQRGNGAQLAAIESLGLLSANLSLPVLQPLAIGSHTLARAAALRVMVTLAARTPLPPSANAPSLAAIFRIVVSSPLLVRVMLASELRRHVQSLSVQGIPEILKSERRSSALLAALQMVESWRCGLPLQELQSLMHHTDGGIRAAALRLAPLEALHSGENAAWGSRSLSVQSNAGSVVPLVISGLLDSDVRVKVAALSAAAGLQISSALPLIKSIVDANTHGHLASLACIALANMGPQGRAILQSKIHSGQPGVAASAVEALAGVQLAHAAAYSS